MEQNAERARVRELERLIARHQDLYYNGQPELSDEDFDSLWDELSALDPDNPLLAKVGADGLDGWPKAAHIMPMGSQSKATDPESFLAWARKWKPERFIVQHKLDGASIELQYRQGRLAKAVTRGDGKIGDDITRNAVKMRGVLPRLDVAFDGAVRGEVLMDKKVHKEKHSDKANCRNAANGVMKRKDGTGAEDLTVLCYDAESRPPALTAGDGLFSELDVGSAGVASALFRTEMDKVAWLERRGFLVVRTVVLESANEVIEYRGKVMADRSSLDFDIDGLVVKCPEVDREDLAKSRPEKQIAFKFSPEEAVTTLVEVEWSESGPLYTPIGIVEPVRLAGTTVKRANLSNPGMIRNMRLMIGSRVVITKRGEIIPKIETLVDNPADAVPIATPEICGTCGATLVDGGTSLSCPNPGCPKRSLHRLERWLSVLDIKDFGSKLIGRLHSSGLVRSVPDLYRLDESTLAGVERMGEVSAAKLLKNLHSRKELSLQEFMEAFDIDGVGPLIADKIVSAGFSSLEKLFSASVEDLASVEGLGVTLAGTILASLQRARLEMESLLSSGFMRLSEQLDEGGTGLLAGRSFCFTGELISMKRQEAERIVRTLGGSVKSSVTKDLDYLVTNDPGSGSGKNRKAAALGVPAIGEEEFLRMIGRPVSSP